MEGFMARLLVPAGKSKKEDSAKEEKRKRETPAQAPKSAKPAPGSKSQQLLPSQQPAAPQAQQGGFSAHKEIKLTLLNKVSTQACSPLGNSWRGGQDQHLGLWAGVEHGGTSDVALSALAVGSVCRCWNHCRSSLRSPCCLWGEWSDRRSHLSVRGTIMLLTPWGGVHSLLQWDVGPSPGQSSDFSQPLLALPFAAPRKPCFASVP